MSTKPAQPEFLIIGKIIKPHGVKGEVSVKILTDFTERFDAMETVLLGDDHSEQAYTIETTRWHKDHILMTFKGINSRNEAETLRNLHLKVPLEEAATLEAESYYHHQLIGLQAITDTGELLGQLVEVLETGANDVYVIQGERSEILLPATLEVIPKIDLEKGQITVHLIEGLIE